MTRIRTQTGRTFFVHMVDATQVVVYNGAETRLSQTIAFLQSKLKTQVVLKNDPTVPVDIVITTTSQTPALNPPPTG